jgi:hypothetical protein
LDDGEESHTEEVTGGKINVKKKRNRRRLTYMGRLCAACACAHRRPALFFLL